MSKEIEKFPDHYEVGKVKYTVIDLEQQKVVKTVDVPKEEQGVNDIDYGRAAIEVSPDGKYIYQIGDKITILQADDFKIVDHIDLAKPNFPGMEHVHFGGDLDLINEPGQHISIFNSEDPVVHNKIFGLGAIRFEHPRRWTSTRSALHPVAWPGCRSPPTRNSPIRWWQTGCTEISAANSGRSI